MPDGAKRTYTGTEARVFVPDIVSAVVVPQVALLFETWKPLGAVTVMLPVVAGYNIAPETENVCEADWKHAPNDDSEVTEVVNVPCCALTAKNASWADAFVIVRLFIFCP